MENSAAVSGILEVYGELAQRHDNIALTVQSHLHRTDDDLAAVIAAAARSAWSRASTGRSPRWPCPAAPNSTSAT
ncbi:hypothetical protein ACFQV2_07815 [Actinokineospora soli]|uniref:Uncharacterized protein n=1 Tax=Actinokineospora soli TaxID=1048753 RepID=A0ABW2TL20_9PSEU